MADLMNIPVTTLAGESTTLAKYKGKVLLIVNVASECGFTPQYEGLEAIYKRFHDRGFEVLGFPSNDFAGQEPGTSAEIGAFCTSRFAVTFPMFEKIPVVGEGKSALYRALTAAQPKATSQGSGLRDGLTNFAASHGLPAPTEQPEVMWNFEKFLVDKHGSVVGRFESDITPDSPVLVEAIEKAMNA